VELRGDASLIAGEGAAVPDLIDVAGSGRVGGNRLLVIEVDVSRISVVGGPQVAPSSVDLDTRIADV
jgi:hypothetical protein